MPQKDKSVALILEILPGLFGFLGFGWIYSNQISKGVIILISMFVWIVIATVITILTGGIFACCALPVNVAAIAISAFMLNNHMKEHPGMFK